MPTYEYQCLKCKKKFDKLQGMNDPKLKSCIYCKGKVERLIGGGAGLIFKGSGFYITDYKNKSSAGDSKKRASESDSKKPASETKKTASESTAPKKASYKK